MINNHVIKTTDLSKQYSDVKAVDQINLEVNKGDIYGFIGLNGAGKSTTIRMLLGMIQPTQGHVELFGQKISQKTRALWHRVGHLVESPTAYGELTVRENLEAARLMQGLADRQVVIKSVDQMDLTAHLNRKAKVLSQGNLQRLGLARALLHKPELLILDEPANALDPAGVVEIRELLARLAKEQGITIFMSSHILAEVDKLVTHLGIIHNGVLVQEMNAQELNDKRHMRLEIETSDNEQAKIILEQAGFNQIRIAKKMNKQWLESQDQRLLDHPEAGTKLLTKAELPPKRLVVTQENLEEYFLRLTLKQDKPS